MGDWADRAVSRYFSNISNERQAEERELILHHKLVAGSERLWKSLHKFIKTETADFNRQTRPDFFQVTESEDRIEVTSPAGTLKCWLDKRIPQVMAEHYQPPAPLTREFSVGTRKDKDGNDLFFLIDKQSSAWDIEIIGGQLLDPLLA